MRITWRTLVHGLALAALMATPYGLTGCGPKDATLEERREQTDMEFQNQMRNSRARQQMREDFEESQRMVEQHQANE